MFVGTHGFKYTRYLIKISYYSITYWADYIKDNITPPLKVVETKLVTQLSSPEIYPDLYV